MAKPKAQLEASSAARRGTAEYLGAICAHSWCEHAAYMQHAVQCAQSVRYRPLARYADLLTVVRYMSGDLQTHLGNRTRLFYSCS